ncbi:MAG: ROK family protein [Fimbriimonadaceae bacterium]|nr:ROK family protein [Fimbriimonadaceae bacterium]
MAGYTVGVDVGGTKILAAVVDEAGAVLARAKYETPASTSDELMEAVVYGIREAIRLSNVGPGEIDAIGLGVPGVVGPAGNCIWAPNCPLTGVPVADLVTAAFGVPAAVGNDVNVGTLGEKAFGAARDYQNVFGMFVGTGIGGGLVIDGKVILGDHCLGAEVGHIIVDAFAALRGDEGGGEFEYYASRLGIERQVRAALAAGRECVLAGKLDGDDDRLKSGALRKALAAGDAVVTEVMDQVAALLGLGCVTVIHLVDPEAIVLGGGVMEACGDYLQPRIEATVQQHVAPGNGQPIRLLRSELGDDAVLLGAVALARGVMVTDTAYPNVSATEFGLVTVDGIRYENDIVIRPDGEVKKRKKKLSRSITGSAHRVSQAEVEYLGRGRPAVLVIGSGHCEQLTLTPEAAAWLEVQQIRVELLPTPQAAAAYTRAAGRKALLLHVTD